MGVYSRRRGAMLSGATEGMGACQLGLFHSVMGGQLSSLSEMGSVGERERGVPQPPLAREGLSQLSRAEGASVSTVVVTLIWIGVGPHPELSGELERVLQPEAGTATKVMGDGER